MITIQAWSLDEASIFKHWFDIIFYEITESMNSQVSGYFAHFLINIQDLFPFIDSQPIYNKYSSIPSIFLFFQSGQKFHN